MREDVDHTPLLEFEWEIPRSGYRWLYAVKLRGAFEREPLRAVEASDPARQNADSERRVLLPVDLQGSAPKNRYRLLNTEPALHRTLAATDVSEAAILAFANQHGTLGLQRTEVNVAGLLNAPGIVYRPWLCDSFEDWNNEIVALRRALELWATVRSNLGDDSGREQLRQDLEPHIKDLEGKLTLSRHGTWLGLNVGPKNLCTAAWLQFANETTGRLDFRRCAKCGRWFPFSPQTAKREQIFCSQSCRSKSYRARQDEARRMNSAGIPFEEIAAQLKSDPSTVRGWISGQSGKSLGKEN